MILCARRYWRGQCHGGLPACFSSVLYTVEEGTPPCTAHLKKRLVCHHNIDHVSNDEHIESYVVLAKHETAPWTWFLREPKHVWAIVGILIVLIFLWFYNCLHQFGIIKSALITTLVFCSVNFLFQNHAVYEILWNNMVQLDSPQMAVQYGACALHARSLKAAGTHSECIILLFHGSSVYENVLHCYVVRTYVWLWWKAFHSPIYWCKVIL